NDSFARAEWSLLNGLGQLVAAGQLNGTVNVLDFSNQAVGQYMLQLRNETDVQTVKLIIE
ncbi:MAG: T9SS type A sorting domain-containing protein, partial [Flavobacteriales bacterium]